MHYKSKTSPHYVRKKLQDCPDSYVESVGKVDIETLGHVFDNDQGTGTVLRLIMGATTEMPLRALSYVTSALGCARILPCQQVQIIHANNLGSAVNGTNREASREQARLLAAVARVHIQALAPDIAPLVLHAEDTPHDLTVFKKLAEKAIGRDETLRAGLAAKGGKHGGDSVTYAAAHCAFQDTNTLRLQPLLPDSVPQAEASTVVSIGCQQETLFYKARVAMRRIAEEEEPRIPLVATAQIYTRHLTPPYFTARGGEQTLEDALENGVDLRQAADNSTMRDLVHLQNLVLVGANL